ncbi:hypothetical protein NMD99_00455 [Wolbachia endosymbiont of Listronotus oregonensis]|nr:MULTISPECIES: hypothetical protein [unclassified Wolbachia]WMT84546.1 hypothetical protein NMD99_00455 [Wolbachia endosymbiont of Listronotus oregonensis]
MSKQTIANPSKVSPSAKINSRIDIGPKVLQSFSYGMLDGKP